MDSSETSTNSQLDSDFSHPIAGAGSFSAAESRQRDNRNAGDVSRHSNAEPPESSPVPGRRQAASDHLRSRQPKHRIAQVRESQAVTLRTISRRSGVPVRILRQQEQPHTDLKLSELMIWAKALEVPLAELLAEPDDSLCATIAQRAQMVRLMKTVEAMRAHASAGSLRRISDVLRQQLLEIMPELDDVTAWPKEGSRRPHGSVGRIAMQPIATARIDAPSPSDSTG